MAITYPTTLDSLTNPVSTDLTNSVTVPHATQHSDLNDAVEAIEAELGTLPKGASASVKARFDTLDTLVGTKSPSASPTFTGTVVLPATTSIDTVSATEISYLDGVTSAIQTQITAKAPSASPTFTGTVTLPNAVVNTATNAISASATQTQVAATAMTTTINRVTVVATAGDAVKLPAATAGKVVIVKNADAADAAGVFPASGDAINALSANAVYSLAALKGVLFFCAVAGTWDTILTA